MGTGSTKAQFNAFQNFFISVIVKIGSCQHTVLTSLIMFQCICQKFQAQVVWHKLEKLGSQKVTLKELNVSLGENRQKKY